MKTIFTRKEFALALACALAFGLMSEVRAQVRADEHAIVMDSNGAPVTSGFGLCLHSGFGPAPLWNAKCHGEFAAPMAQRIEPATAPAPAPVVLAAAAPLPITEKVVFDANVLFDSDQSALAADRVQSSARGETRPTTQPGECKDANTAKNVACMQPDRHVSIAVSGTRIAK